MNTFRAAAGNVTKLRLVGLDRLRGAAVLAMVLDHLALVIGGLDLVRLTAGRLALPLFFVVGGALVARLRWRLLGVALVGLALPVVVPWIDNPNVLLVYATGALGLVQLEKLRARLEPRTQGLVTAAVLVLCLTLLANGWGQVGSSFSVPALLALMVVGSQLGRVQLDEWGRWVPSWCAPVGRWPLSVYVGHLLVLQGLVVVAS